MAPPVNPELKKREAVAVRVSEAFRSKGFRVIQYGGATVEQYCRGHYTTGDVDLGFLGTSPPREMCDQIMASIGCKTISVRLFVLDDVVIDLGGEAEMLSPNFIEIHTPEGVLVMESPEESLIQRVLISVYPQEQPDQKAAALALMVQALSGALPLDRAEVDRLAQLPGFKVAEVVASYFKEAESLIAKLKKNAAD